ncbi:MAG: hypothetical protein EI684_02695 [Candidatus Viridilinea halotolerans]|uniref:Zinc-finger domain-containing protein n=1 Tax=Candidatus Viridilinea halotolerans TaxID=2491704 RepID=A0A426U8L2_9CHLR|nr:MAG: hypothetical protein EI684_02695 [Candidatus Viridilinea halotolerans]
MTILECGDERCAMPPALSDAELMAAADGEADDAILQHLQHCPDCAVRLTHLRVLQVRLRQRLYRVDCLSTDLLIDYCQGLLDPYQYALVLHHLALCPHCMAEVAQLEQGHRQVDVLFQTSRRLLAPVP